MSAKRASLRASSGTVVQFLEQVLPEDGWSTLVAIDPERTARSVAVRATAATLRECERWLNKQSDDRRNLYWTVNQVASAIDKKPTKRDIVTFHYVHLDVDDPSEAAVQRLQGLPPAPVNHRVLGRRLSGVLEDRPASAGKR